MNLTTLELVLLIEVVAAIVLTLIVIALAGGNQKAQKR